ncbi:Uma2 family endonuclease [Longimicrobium sp.]|uniref:Uma2 family endonuclease n=1 Tax=Longimicrobium sp. TaxID=2029185 RepID=UPI002E2F8872|nr:Uma2 family endonuclease [Longimicrobium sp.]HEX6037455.1 Uma2 family endonuclease [Longimicrobium sp.]
MATAALKRITPDEYLARERHAEFRSEYLNGRILAMTGASLQHAEIVLNIGSTLRDRLRARGCRVFVNDVRVRIASVSGYVYPDVVALCGTPAVLDTRPPTLTNPHLVIEVLSGTTERYDRGEKFEAYRASEALAEYVLVDSRRVHVERYVRHGDFWVHSAATELDTTLELSSVGTALTLREIYADVQFDGGSEE